MTLSQSYTYELVRERAPIRDSPWTCGNPKCDECVPPLPDWEPAPARMTCPRCGDTMHHAPMARPVLR